MSESSPTSPVAVATADSEAQLRQDAIADADPLQRVYDTPQTIPHLSTAIGILAKLIILQQREDIADYALEFFEQLVAAREKDTKNDMDTFLWKQAKDLQRALTSVPYVYSSTFVPPAGFQDTLKAFAKECVRYQPKNFLEFGQQYFKALNDDDLNAFLLSQAKAAEQKQKEAEFEKKRAAALAKKKEKLKAAQAAKNDDE